MPMTVIVTRNAQDRIRGFLSSCMCEIAPGVYIAPRMTAAVRERVWNVLEGWSSTASETALVMTWPEPALPGGQGLKVLGVPRTEVCDHDGVYLTRRDIPEEAPAGSLKTSETKQPSG